MMNHRNNNHLPHVSYDDDDNANLSPGRAEKKRGSEIRMSPFAQRSTPQLMEESEFDFDLDSRYKSPTPRRRTITAVYQNFRNDTSKLSYFSPSLVVSGRPVTAMIHGGGTAEGSGSHVRTTIHSPAAFGREQPQRCRSPQLLLEPSSRKLARGVLPHDRHYRRWSPEEDDLLKRAIQETCGGVPPIRWTKIRAKYFPYRTAQQIRSRWGSHLDPTLKSGEWTAAEDAKLVALQQRGLKFNEIAKLLDGRSTCNVRVRFESVLDPTLNKAQWEEAELQKLLAVVETHGPKWKQVARVLGNGRSDIMCKNKWFNTQCSLERKRRRQCCARAKDEEDWEMNLAPASIPHQQDAQAWIDEATRSHIHNTSTDQGPTFWGPPELIVCQNVECMKNDNNANATSSTDGNRTPEHYSIVVEL